MAKLEAASPDQAGDGMLQQGAARQDIGELRLGIGELGLRPAHIQAGRDALVVPVIGEGQRLADRWSIASLSSRASASSPRNCR